jgi:hypothetical protein
MMTQTLLMTTILQLRTTSGIMQFTTKTFRTLFLLHRLLLLCRLLLYLTFSISFMKLPVTI